MEPVLAAGMVVCVGCSPREISDATRCPFAGGESGALLLIAVVLLKHKGRFQHLSERLLVENSFVFFLRHDFLSTSRERLTRRARQPEGMCSF